MKRIFWTYWLLILCSWSLSAQRYQTRAMVSDIATLRVQYEPGTVTSPYLSRPVLTLGGEEVLDVSFDQLSHDVHFYTYTLRHLDYDNTPDDLMAQEYMDGSLTCDITDYEQSLNTQQAYTHYRFSFPNSEMRPTVSGNYALIIYEDNDPEKVVATVCVPVTENGASIAVKVRGNTDIEYSGRYQQLDVDVDLGRAFSTMDSRFSALVVEQNGRQDNKVCLTAPTFMEPQRLRWLNNRALIFEGGNEYRHFDVSSEYFMGAGVDHIYFDHEAAKMQVLTSGYHAYLFEDEPRTGGYLYNEDANGRYVINKERTDEDDTEADYMWVHWLLPMRQMDGELYVMGDLTGGMAQRQAQMHYDMEHGVYLYTAYLKQGGYEWLYTYKNNKSTRAGEGATTTQAVEGSYWQTRNAYRIFYYYKGKNDRYTRLLAVENAENVLISN